MYRPGVSAQAILKLSFVIIAFLTVITGCGGGGGGGGTVAPTYTISGNVSGSILAGVTITLTGTATASTTTGADGSYSFTGLQNGSYNLTPSASGYTFTPAALTSVTVNGANVTGQNFVAAAVPTYTVSGSVSGLIDEEVVRITLGGNPSRTVSADSSGNYSFAGVVNGSYTVTPVAAGYTFSPASAQATVSDGNATGVNFTATAKTSVTWKEFVLSTSASSAAGWRRRTLKFSDANPAVLFAAWSCLDSAGSTTCPTAGSLIWTATGGDITESGADSSVHMTMTSTKNFIAGTGGPSTAPHLRVALKVVPGTIYTNADLQGRSFVFHEMVVGTSTMWRYGSGSTSGPTDPVPGAVTLSSKTDPSGKTTTPDTSWGTLAVGTDGVVTISGLTTFSGFLADDKKTIVGTYTSGTTYRLMILQITERSDYPAGPLPASAWKSSFLAKSTSIPIVGVQAGWIYCTNMVDAGGNMTFGTDWTSSNTYFQDSRPTTSFTGNITSSGEVTMTESSSYNGQASHDWNFLVGTMTLVTTVNPVGTVTIYLLQVSTR